MSLKEYVSKRHFEATPEPAPDPKRDKPHKQPFFCVQRHDATRLHYDFRLEIDGTLKSWAVPKGPTLDPIPKHLAMHVEDHPLDYGNFEGNIPAGNYGGGSVMLWDRGTFELIGDTPGQAQIERGDLKFHLHGEKINGDFALVHMRNRGKGNEWLLLKKRDEFAQEGWDVEAHAVSVLTGRTQEEIAKDLPALKKAKAPARKAAAKKTSSKKNSIDVPSGAVLAPLPGFVEPMAATLAEEPPRGASWLYEVKWDGVRALCYIQDGRVTMYTRNGNRCEQQYPELSVLPHFIEAETAVLDGEVAVMDSKGRSSFGLIQGRLHVTDPNSISHLARKSPVTLLLFDLLYCDGYDYRGVGLLQRKEKLHSLLKPSERIRYSDHFAAKGEEMLAAARLNGLEGVLAKQAESKYEHRRSRNWLKIKVQNVQEFVVAGFTHGERPNFSSLILGLYENGTLIPVGQVGTGFNDKNSKELFADLKPRITDKSPFAAKVKTGRDITWIKPELVAQIKYLEFTKDGNLRAPVYLGLRNDKDPHDCVREVSEVPVAPAKATAPTEQKFSNLTKIFYPGEGITKGDVISYYDAVAELIVPHLRDRPLSLKRYPNGIKQDFFFQKNVADKFPDWIRTEPISSESSDHHTIQYVICNDKATLLYLANLGCIDQNPWMSRVGSLENPDFLLIDLDPQECGFDKIVEAALLVRKQLDAIGLQGFPKTTGGDGLHIYVPLQPAYTYDQVRSFAEILSHLVLTQKKELFTTPRSVAKRRKGTVYFDYMQIGKSKTIAAPYVLRAYPGAPVATPLEWKEVKKGLTPDQFTIKNAMKRFETVGDLFAGVLTEKQQLEPAMERLHAAL